MSVIDNNELAQGGRFIGHVATFSWSTNITLVPCLGNLLASIPRGLPFLSFFFFPPPFKY